MENETDAFELPPYLLKTPYGESLQKQLTQPVPTRPDLSKATRLSTSGVMGSVPSRYDETEYDQNLVALISNSPHITNTASRRGTSTADLDGDNPMRDEGSANDDDDGPLSSIHYTNDAMDVVDDEDVEDALDIDEDDVDIDDYPGQHVALRRMISAARRSRRSSVRGSRSGTIRSARSSISGGFKYPLPLKWDSAGNNMIVTEGGLGLKVEQSRSSVSQAISKNYEFQNARADASIPVHAGVFYYEVKVLTTTNNNNNGSSDIALGFIYASIGNITKMAGLEIGSYGFNGMDGSTTANQTVSRRYNRKFGKGDIIGCGVNFATKSIFYTKNGVYLGPAFKDINKALIPVISMKSGNSVSTNFGMDPFVFDIEGYIDQEKLKVSQRVLEHTSTSNITGSNNSLNDVDLRANTTTDKEIPDIMQNLVSSYFDHLGYVDISKTFAEEVKKEQLETKTSSAIASQGDAVMDDVEVERSPEENNLEIRQQIRKGLLEGDIDGAIKLTNVHFPSVFEEHGKILFKLCCNKFIQLIKTSRIDEAIQLGQDLREKYNTNMEYQEFLNDIFSLLAYETPEESEFGYLLKEDEILKISDELNSEILKSLGKSSISELERLMRHTKAMLKVLNSDKAQLDTLLLTNEDFGL